MGGASSRRHANFLALEIRYGLDRRSLEPDDLSLGDLSREYDLDRHAVGGDADGIGRGRGKSNVDSIGDERTGRAVDFSELNPFDIEAFLFGEFHLLHDCTETQAETAGPIANLHLLTKQRAGHR